MSFSSYGQVIEKTVKATKYMATDTIKSMSGNGINVFGNQLKWLADPTASQDGVNLRFLSSYMLRSDSLTKFITPTQLNDSLVSINDALNDTLAHIQRTETFTGLKNFSNMGKVTFNTGLSTSFNYGQLGWNSEAGTLSFGVTDGSIEVNQEEFDYYVNLEGTPIVNGNVVSISSATGNRTAVNLTDATDLNRSRRCVGMVTVPSISNNNTGRITKSGKVKGLNTSHLTEGAIVYVDPAKKGRLTDTIPTAPNTVIRVGICDVTSTNAGVIDLHIAVMPSLQELSDVNGTPLTVSGQIPVWNNTGGYFDFTDNVTDSVVHIQRTQTITGSKTFSSNVAVNAQGVGIGVNAETTVDNGYDIGLSALAWKDPILAANKTTSITNAYINGMTMRVNSANIVSPTAGIGVGTIYRLPILGWSDPAISDKDAAKVGAYWTDITQGSEDAKYSIKLTYNGVVDTERFAVHSTGDIETPRGAYHYYRQTLGTNTLGDWRTYADANNFYTEYYDGSTWVMKGQIQK